MGSKRMVGAVVSAWVVVVGCGPSEPELGVSPELESVAAELATTNGVNLNGVNLNGVNLNGPLLNRRLVSVSYEGARREGMSTPMDEVWLEGSQLYALMGGEELSGTDFQQMRLAGNLDNGTTVALRVDNVFPGSGADADVWTYHVSYQDPADGNWYPLCTKPGGVPTNAIALENRWNYGQGVAGGGSKIYDTTSFTFACEGAALAKCVRFGYAPWRTKNGTSLADHHQACTRMVRADFCGDGTSYTSDGKWVNLYDSLNVQTDTESWSKEAAWNGEGASCFTSHTRATAPIQCASGRQVETCGQNFTPGTLIISETPAQ
ncbi:MAG TPA: ADYC domain-containing protein [Myxococcaceae bacterium]|jgi:hypothetical protein